MPSSSRIKVNSALITASNGGLGKAAAKAMVKEGVNVVIEFIDRKQDGLALWMNADIFYRNGIYLVIDGGKSSSNLWYLFKANI